MWRKPQEMNSFPEGDRSPLTHTTTKYKTQPTTKNQNLIMQFSQAGSLRDNTGDKCEFKYWFINFGLLETYKSYFTLCFLIWH